MKWDDLNIRAHGNVPEGEIWVVNFDTGTATIVKSRGAPHAMEPKTTPDVLREVQKRPQDVQDVQGANKIDRLEEERRRR